MIASMIQDSIPWKDELLKVAKRLEAKAKQRRWTERSGFLVERDVMVSAYAIRKLIEGFKVSDALAARQLPVTRFDLRGSKAPDVLDKYEFWEHYNLDHGIRETLSVIGLCNQLIHSWMWSISADEQTTLFNGLYVSSDRQRKRSIYFLSISDLIQLIYDVGNEDVYSKTITRNADGAAFTQILGRPYASDA